MNICLNRSHGFAKCLRVQQVAYYNDNPKNFPSKKPWRHHINSMRKTGVLRKMLQEYEPTAHDVLFDEAKRFSEADFRAQLLHLRGEWGKMYTDLDIKTRAARDIEYNRLEEDRSAFIEQIEQQQSDKRSTSVLDKYVDMERKSLDDEYRRTTLSSPEVEVDSFLSQQQDDSLVTPQNFDHAIEQLLSEDYVPFADKIVTNKRELKTFKKYDIEFVLDGHSTVSRLDR